MEQGRSWNVNNQFTNYDTPHLLEAHKFHYRLHNSPTLNLIRIYLKPADVLKPYIFNISFNIILPYTPTFTV